MAQDPSRNVGWDPGKTPVKSQERVLKDMYNATVSQVEQQQKNINKQKPSFVAAAARAAANASSAAARPRPQPQRTRPLPGQAGAVHAPKIIKKPPAVDPKRPATQPPNKPQIRAPASATAAPVTSAAKPNLRVATTWQDLERPHPLRRTSSQATDTSQTSDPRSSATSLQAAQDARRAAANALEDYSRSPSASAVAAAQIADQPSSPLASMSEVSTSAALSALAASRRSSASHSRRPSVAAEADLSTLMRTISARSGSVSLPSGSFTGLDGSSLDRSAAAVSAKSASAAAAAAGMDKSSAKAAPGTPTAGTPTEGATLAPPTATDGTGLPASGLAPSGLPASGLPGPRRTAQASAAARASAMKPLDVAPRVPLSSKFVSTLSAALKHEKPDDDTEEEQLRRARNILVEQTAAKMSAIKEVEPQRSPQSTRLGSMSALAAAQKARPKAETEVARIHSEVASRTPRRQKRYRPSAQWSGTVTTLRPRAPARPIPTDSSAAAAALASSTLASSMPTSDVHIPVGSHASSASNSGPGSASQSTNALGASWANFSSFGNVGQPDLEKAAPGMFADWAGSVESLPQSTASTGSAPSGYSSAHTGNTVPIAATVSSTSTSTAANPSSTVVAGSPSVSPKIAGHQQFEKGAAAAAFGMLPQRTPPAALPVHAHKKRGFFGRLFKSEDGEELVPQRSAGPPPAALKSTMREHHSGKRKIFNEEKPWKHRHEIAVLSEKERKRYERLWAANKGRHVRFLAPVMEHERDMQFLASLAPTPNTQSSTFLVPPDDHDVPGSASVISAASTTSVHPSQQAPMAGPTTGPISVPAPTALPASLAGSGPGSVVGSVPASVRSMSRLAPEMRRSLDLRRPSFETRRSIDTRSIQSGDTLENYERQQLEDIHGYVVAQLWRRSCLSDDVLNQIWDLVDVNHDGTLNRSSFVVGMWLVDQCLYGRKLPRRIDETIWRSVGHLQVKVRVKEPKHRFHPVKYVGHTAGHAGHGLKAVRKAVLLQNSQDKAAKDKHMHRDAAKWS